MKPSILVMAKAPRPGLTKTRLEPRLGREGCARLQVELIRHTLAWASRFAPGRVHVAATPTDAAHELAALGDAQTRVFPQCEGDLGARLHHAIAHVLGTESGPLVVVATDAPTLDERHARAAAEAIESGHDACFGAALDGGYVSVTLARPLPALFALPTEKWGGPEVLSLSLDRAKHAGISAYVLPAEPDLDTPEDAAMLQSDPRVPQAIAALLRPR